MPNFVGDGVREHHGVREVPAPCSFADAVVEYSGVQSGIGHGLSHAERRWRESLGRQIDLERNVAAGTAHYLLLVALPQGSGVEEQRSLFRIEGAYYPLEIDARLAEDPSQIIDCGFPDLGGKRGLVIKRDPHLLPGRCSHDCGGDYQKLSHSRDRVSGLASGASTTAAIRGREMMETS
jgi:hypothetical protein